MPRTGKTALAYTSCSSMFQSRIQTHWTVVLTSTKHDYVVFPSRSPMSVTDVGRVYSGDTCRCDILDAQVRLTALYLFRLNGFLFYWYCRYGVCTAVGDARRRRG